MYLRVPDRCRDGRIVDFPLGGEDNYQLQMKYGIDSTLLQADWMDTSVGNYDTCIRRYYDIGSGRLTQVSQSTYKVGTNSFCE
ncbi:hypothetical protein HNQ95_002240 [Aminobacter ciceronei]|uniref:Uncharacterized protein n=1 Tax=Aminobacter ciceronei TaxID=150723 RepID=A0ABR6C628_9HYPH|nr:hypothetical protein [Aminobacter ciceronei]MBA9020409.1 hypothetical protein [Aminobacter ciceronei]